MLDSYKTKSESDTNTFNAYDHLGTLCKAHHVVLSEFTRVTYQSGWMKLLGQLVLELKDYPVRLIEVDDSHGQLDIKFEMLKQRNEVMVWRKLSHFKNQSRAICMGCGNKSNNLKTNGLSLKLCADCFNSASKNGKTGTWLDKY